MFIYFIIFIIWKENCVSQFDLIWNLICTFMNLVWSDDVVHNMRKRLLSCAPNEDSDSRSLIGVFVAHMKKICILGYPKCAKRRFLNFAERTSLNVRFLMFWFIEFETQLAMPVRTLDPANIWAESTLIWGGHRRVSYKVFINVIVAG